MVRIGMRALPRIFRLHPIFALAVGALLGCAGLAVKPVPLYPSPERPAEELSMFVGQVEKIDTVDVTKKGMAFQLLPGCHVVQLKTTYAAGSASGSWSASIPKQTYAIRMRAGHSYEIDIQRVSGASGLGIVTSVGNSSAGGSLRITATEYDKDRRILQTLAPAADDGAIAACKEWEKQGGAAEQVSGDGGVGEVVPDGGTN